MKHSTRLPFDTTQTSLLGFQYIIIYWIQVIFETIWCSLCVDAFAFFSSFLFFLNRRTALTHIDKHHVRLRVCDGPTTNIFLVLVSCFSSFAILQCARSRFRLFAGYRFTCSRKRMNGMSSILLMLQQSRMLFCHEHVIWFVFGCLFAYISYKSPQMRPHNA